jgi:hypothetical protein
MMHHLIRKAAQAICIKSKSLDTNLLFHIREKIKLKPLIVSMSINRLASIAVSIASVSDQQNGSTSVVGCPSRHLCRQTNTSTA